MEEKINILNNRKGEKGAMGSSITLKNHWCFLFFL